MLRVLYSAEKTGFFLEKRWNVSIEKNVSGCWSVAENDTSFDDGIQVAAKRRGGG